MNEPSCRRYRADWLVAWVYLIGAGLLLLGLPAGAFDAGAPEEARRKSIELLRRSQNESGRRSIYLPQAYEQIQLGLSESKDDPLQQGQWLEALWEYHLLNDDHAQARQALERSLQFLTAARADAALIDRVTSNLSYSLILVGEVAQAKDLLRRAIVSATQQENRALLAELYYGLGDAYRKTGERLVAQRYFEAAYELDQASGDMMKISISRLKLGSLARDRGDYREAIDWHEQALQVFIDERNYRELVTYIELARDHAALGDLRLAQSYAQLALDDPRALPEQRIDASALLLRIANDQRARGVEAPKHAARASQLVHDIEALINGSSARQRSQLARPTHQLQFAEQAIRHHALNGDLANVRTHGQAAIRLARRVAHDLRATHDDSLAWLTAAQPVLNQYVQATYELDQPQVLPLLETYYAQRIAPAELRHSGVVGRAYEAETIELFERYRSARRALMDSNAALDRLHPDATDVRRQQDAKSRLDQALREWDRARDAYLTTYRAPIGSSPPREQIRFRPVSIPATDVFIRYFIQENVSFGIALAGKEIRYFDLPPRSAVQPLVQRSLDLLNAPGRVSQAEATLSALAEFLPRDFLREHSTARRLVIVPDDVMQPLPFAAIDLDDRPQNYAPLISQFEVVRAKSLSSYYADRAAAPKAAAKNADIVVFVDPLLSAQSRAAAPKPGSPLLGSQPQTVLPAIPNSDPPLLGPQPHIALPAIPSSGAEADSIAKMFAPRVTTFAGLEATSAVLLSPEVRAAKILHIATHGYFSKTTPDLVGLVTSGGFLGFTELFSAPFSTELVIISGCETMRGRDYTGWGVRSVADGFLSQGAGSVIGTLWSVSDAATAELMEGFYRHLHRGAGSSAALQAAQRELVASRRFSDPYYWAGVTLASSNRGYDQQSF